MFRFDYVFCTVNILKHKGNMIITREGNVVTSTFCSLKEQNETKFKGIQEILN